MQKKLVKLAPHNMNSLSAKVLAEGLGVRRLRIDGSMFKPKPEHVVINWGRIMWYDDPPGKFINDPKVVHRVSNKMHFLDDLDGAEVPCPESTASLDEAIDWIAKGSVVLGRKKRGFGGQDIIFSDDEAKFGDFLDSELFTKYIPKKHEFRVHVFGNKIIDTQQKKLRKIDADGNETDPKRINFRVRNLENGFIFARSEIDVPPRVHEVALKAHKVSELDFGAYDIIYNEKHGEAYVLEVNTAPGLSPTTLDNYTKAFQEMLNLG